MLWVFGGLSRLEELCISSFVRKGYKVSLWTYATIFKNAPAGCTVRNAREVLAEEHLFLNQRGSFAGFSDLFRYAVLRRFGGLYSDVDVIAVKHAKFMPSHAFFVTENSEDGGSIINGNVIHAPSPSAGDIIDQAYSYALDFPKEKVQWGEIGPQLLTAFSKKYPQHGYAIMEPDFSNPVSWWLCPQRLLEDDVTLPDSCHFLHLYNEMWRQAGIDKNAALPERSLPMRAYFSN